MSDKQRLAHNRARYWEGPLTRAEAQKVFDETAGVIQKQQEVLQKLDMVMAFLIEKSGYTVEEIQAWMNDRIAKMQAEQKAAQEAKDPDGVLVTA